MNKHSLLFSLVFATAPVLLANQAIAAVPPLDGIASPADTKLGTCPTLAPATGIIRHFDKIIFRITGPLIAAAAADQPALDALPRNPNKLDIKVFDNPKTIADLKGKVLTFLGAKGTLQDTANRSYITIDDVDYAVILCPKAP
jgi:hypothetical protein